MTGACAKISSKDLRKNILAKAIVDPRFRQKLFKSPEVVFGGKLSKVDLAALERIKKFLPSVDDLVTGLAGEILCGGGGGCGGLA
ncbi:MAG TPA: hypothetical protein ACFYD2_10235 [Candidatus Avalokitesvara rifleensis]|uniref:hypothetical protein n=1 Tax=Candidatus Avalokitesvara rifleensis TaxID=3367620 RepID=UPI004027FDF1